MKTALAIIPARGGSKGIPQKNLRPLSGKPLVAHSIGHALQARAVGRVIVSTDDADIATVSKLCGAEVVLRPAELSGDQSASEAALLHVLAVLEARESRLAEIVVFLQCTSPLIRPEDIDGTVNRLIDDSADCCFTAVKFHHFLWRRDAGGGFAAINHDARQRLMRQQLAPQYMEVGAVYAMRTRGFIAARHRFFGKVSVFEIPVERSIEIDSASDLEISELLIQRSGAAQGPGEERPGSASSPGLRKPCLKRAATVAG